jgi:flagellar basal-body rod protein FlgG
MLKGIYKAASAMVPRLKQQEITANNIANASTPGYKKDSIFLKELDSAAREIAPRKSVWQTPMIDQVYTDYGQGSFDKTGDMLNVAIEGNGFFVLEPPEGEGEDMIYTRNGSFSINEEGYLVNTEGLRVMGDGGPIDVGTRDVTIAESGEISIEAGIVGRLQVVDFEDKSALIKVGNSGFTIDETVEPVPVEDASLRQGFLERANINVIKEMVGMIMALRHFEAGSRAIQSQEESLRVLLNQVGRTQM